MATNLGDFVVYWFTETTAPSKYPCRYFFTQGGCRFGTNCRFSHETGCEADARECVDGTENGGIEESPGKIGRRRETTRRKFEKGDEEGLHGPASEISTRDMTTTRAPILPPECSEQLTAELEIEALKAFLYREAEIRKKKGISFCLCTA
jgi:hypothetical protein